MGEGEWRLCEATVRVPANRQALDPVIPPAFKITLEPGERLKFPAQVDSNSPTFWRDGALNVFNSAGKTYLSTGSDVHNLSNPVEVQMPRPQRPGGTWMEAIWPEPDTGVLYGWYHFEPADLGCLTAPIIGAAISRDGGKTWEDEGFVLENGHGIDCGFQNGFFVGGNGDFSVVVGPESKYFYFIFSNYIGPANETGVGIARSLIQDRGQPETVYKYYRGAWDQPGIGGRSTALFRNQTTWAGPIIQAWWGPSVHWNDYLHVYVVLLNRTYGAIWAQDGIYIAFSPDFVNWTQPLQILRTGDYYPQVVGLTGGTDREAGSAMRLYVGGVSDFVLRFTKTE
jgi:hypothetical protein